MHQNIKSKIKKRDSHAAWAIPKLQISSNIHKSHKRFKRMHHNESTNLVFHRKALLPFTYRATWKQWWVPNILVCLKSTKSFKGHISRLGSRPSASDYKFGTLAITKCESVLDCISYLQNAVPHSLWKILAGSCGNIHLKITAWLTNHNQR